MIKRLCEAGQQVAHREKRSTVQHKDIGEIIGVVISLPMNVDGRGEIATVVRKADEFLFLKGMYPAISDDHNADKYREEIMAWTSAEPPAKRAKPKGKGVAASEPTLLDSFVVKAAVETEDIIMDEDGTMYAAGSGS